VNGSLTYVAAGSVRPQWLQTVEHLIHAKALASPCNDCRQRSMRPLHIDRMQPRPKWAGLFSGGGEPHDRGQSRIQEASAHQRPQGVVAYAADD
jgi:hypothetical protein